MCTYMWGHVDMYDASQFLAGKAIIRFASMCTWHVYMHLHSIHSIHLQCTLDHTASGLVVQ